MPIQIHLLPPFHRRAEERRAEVFARTGIRPRPLALRPDYPEIARASMVRLDALPKEYREYVYECGDLAGAEIAFAKRYSVEWLRATRAQGILNRDKAYAERDRKAVFDSIVLDL